MFLVVQLAFLSHRPYTTMENNETIRRTPPPQTAANTVYHSLKDDSLVENNPQNRRASGLSWCGILITTATLLGGTLVIAAAVIYLTFMWFQGPTKRAWTSIVLSNWTATSIAICALAIRWATAFQMILCTSVLAWNMLQKGSSLPKIPRLSALRFSNAGPLDFIFLLSLRSKYTRHIHLLVVILLSILDTIMLQLSSTLLLSDLATSSVESFSNSTSSTILTTDSSDIIRNRYYTDALTSTAPSYPLFAEYLDGNWSQKIENVDDTGPVVRALLPVSVDMGRSKLLRFEGNATLYDARWICTAPIFTNLSLTGYPTSALYLAGFAEHSKYVPPMVSYNFTNNWPLFNCSLPVTQSINTSWTVTTCDLLIENWGIGVVNSLDSIYNSSQLYSTDIDHAILYGPNETSDYYVSSVVGKSWLMLYVTNLNVSTIPTFKYDSWRLAFNDTTAWTSNVSGPWSRVTSTQKDGLILNVFGVDGNHDEVRQPSNWTFELDVSMCSSAFPYTKTMHINAKRNDAVEEPISLMDGISQIGALRSPQNHNKRGIMTLNKTELDRQLFIERDIIVQNHLHITQLPYSYLFNFETASPTLPANARAWFPTAGTSTLTYLGVNEDRLALMQHVLQTTNSPALAMQSMLHTVLTDRYYKYLPYYTNTSVQQSTYSIDAIRPVRNRGYIICMVSVGVHLLLVAYILIVFGILKGTKTTMRSVNQAWQVYRQVAHLQDSLALYREESSTTITDYELETDLKRRGLNSRVYILQNVDREENMRFRVVERSNE